MMTNNLQSLMLSYLNQLQWNIIKNVKTPPFPHVKWGKCELKYQYDQKTLIGWKNQNSQF
jgi:hypothetical protein